MAFRLRTRATILGLMCAVQPALAQDAADSAEPARQTTLSAAANSSARESATLAAIGDGVTTMAVLHTGAGIELNPIMPTSPLGIAAVTAAKAGWLYTRDPAKDRDVLLGANAIFSGLTVNNLLVAGGVGGSLPLIVGLIFGNYVWARDSADPAIPIDVAQVDKNETATEETAN